MRLKSNKKIAGDIAEFIKRLGESVYQGEIDQSLSTRLVLATDNSVYQVMPAAVLFPKCVDDLQAIFKLANAPMFKTLSFTVRGGGTSTNGQSLTEVILVDCSKYLTRIKEVNFEQEWVMVEPGVVLDQLNANLKKQGYFFPISISPSSRATLGGMVNTNACGKGSTFYGRTLDYVLSLKVVLANGELFESETIDTATLARYREEDTSVGKIFRQVDETLTCYQADIEALYPQLPRMLTGYGLKEVWNKEKTHFNLNAIIVGSEGTLTTCAEIKLSIKKIPTQKALIVLQYRHFQAALGDATTLVGAKPEAIETLDNTLLRLAKTDTLYSQVKPYLEGQIPVGGVTLVEFVADTEAEITDQINCLHNILTETPSQERLQVFTIKEAMQIDALWELRKKSVGLLANSDSKRLPVSGVEDTLVPPAVLAEYIYEFRQLLDKENLTYGMFGHVDAGCLHVRPALDMTNPADQALYYALSDKVASLVKKYQGIMWGEHGKGFRSQYVPETFGLPLFKELCKIKAAFDPNDLLNTGKIATPSGMPEALTAIDRQKNRGDFNRQITDAFQAQYAKILACNGNGACFSVKTEEIMCPSYKVTKDRLHSPKGRVALIREWLRVKSRGDKNKLNELSEQVYRALQGCLGCTACKRQCPVQVDIPHFKSLFLEDYYKQKRRRFREIITAYSEKIARFQSHWPRLFNLINTNLLTQCVVNKALKIHDLPKLAVPNYFSLARRERIPALKVEDAAQAFSKQGVVIVADWLNFCYEPVILIKAYQLLKKLGFMPFLLTEVVSGETFKLTGYLKKANQTFQKNKKIFAKLREQGVSCVNLEPSQVVSANEQGDPHHLLVGFIQNFLNETPWAFPHFAPLKKKIVLFLHCMEKSAAITYGRAWLEVFARLGLTLTLAETGCCGMAGMYGHEQEHLAYSKSLYELSWAHYCEQDAILLATGYSCRAQIRRFSQREVRHPVDFLCELFSGNATKENKE